MVRLASLFVLWLAVCFVPLSGCTHAQQSRKSIQAGFSEKYKGRVLALRRSLFSGDLYDDNERRLLSDRAFASTSHFSSPLGVPIHPRREKGIVGAGTLFKIARLEFPDFVTSYIKRIAMSPRFETWLFLEELDSNDGEAAETACSVVQPFVFILPGQQVQTQDDLWAPIDALLGEPEEVSHWLSSRSDAVREGIKDKEAIVGMQLSEVTAALGPPLMQFEGRFSDQSVAKIDYYPDQELWWRRNRLAEIRPSRSLSRARAQLPREVGDSAAAN